MSISQSKGSAVVILAERVGIGRGIAERLVARGYAVVVTDVDGRAAEEVRPRSVRPSGPRHVRATREAHRAAPAAAGGHAVLTAWFNNAGVGDDGDGHRPVRRGGAHLAGRGEPARDAVGDAGGVMVFGPDGGDVVNTASLSGLVPVPGYSVYAATKAAIVSVSMLALLRRCRAGAGARAPPRRGADGDARRPDAGGAGRWGWCTRVGREPPDCSARPGPLVAELVGSAGVVCTLLGCGGAGAGDHAAPSLAARGTGASVPSAGGDRAGTLSAVL